VAVTQGRSAEELTRLMAGVFASAPNIEWIPQISMSRHCSISALTRWLAQFLQLDTYQTLDLSGDELAQPIENFRPLYRVAKDKGLRLKAHVGQPRPPQCLSDLQRDARTRGVHGNAPDPQAL
jgi:adenosine deaminase